MAEALNTRVEYLVTKVKAYEGFHHHGKGLRHAVKSQLFYWSKKQRDMTTIRLPLPYSILRGGGSGRKNHEEYIPEILGADWRTFRVIESTDTHLRVEDPGGRLLAYRLRISERLTQTLADTEYLIPQPAEETHEPGTTASRHWGLWKKCVPEPRMTSEYIRDLPYSKQWFEANAELFQDLSNTLRILEPQMYVRYTRIRKFLPEGVMPTCGAWYACAIDQNTTEDEAIPLVYNDYCRGLNVVTGWGSFTSAKIVLWQLGLAIEVKPGDAIMLLGGMITHNIVDIQGGVRNAVSAFVPQAPVAWGDKKHFGRTKRGKNRKLGKSQKEGKEKGKQKRVGKDTEEEEGGEWVGIEWATDVVEDTEVGEGSG